MTKPQRPGKVIAIMFVGSLLVLLGWSLWRYDYKVRSRLPPPPARIRSGLRVVPSPDGREQTAEFSLRNEGQTRICLLDTAALEPLYQVQVELRVADGFTPAPTLGMPVLTTLGDKLLDGERDAIVELVPGSALVRCIRLSSRFDLRKEGQYRVSVVYQPQVLATSLGEEFDAWGVERCGFVTVADFEIAPKEKPPAPTPPSRPKILPEEAR
jgi:hypothetical protein